MRHGEESRLMFSSQNTLVNYMRAVSAKYSKLYSSNSDKTSEEKMA